MYIPETGDFYWLVPKQGRNLDGKPAGSFASGYCQISINGIQYLAHRLAFFYMTGEWPPEYVDHIDGDTKNNKWVNLRPATAQQNSWNKKRKFNSFTGIKGVRKLLFSDMWEVNIWREGILYSEGPFKTYQQACARYDELALDDRGEFHKPEKPRQQFTTFNSKDVTLAIDEFIKHKTLVNGKYV